MGLDAEADRVADDLVRLAEGDAFVREIRRGGHSVEIAGGGGGLHAVEVELQSAGKGRKHGEYARDRIGGIKDWFLAFLEVFVVSEGQAFDECGQRGCRALQASCLAADELGEVGVLLLRHRAGAGGEGLGKIQKSKFSSRV